MSSTSVRICASLLTRKGCPAVCLWSVSMTSGAKGCPTASVYWDREFLHLCQREVWEREFILYIKRGYGAIIVKLCNTPHTDDTNTVGASGIRRFMVNLTECIKKVAQLCLRYSIKLVNNKNEFRRRGVRVRGYEDTRKCFKEL